MWPFKKKEPIPDGILTASAARKASIDSRSGGGGMQTIGDILETVSCYASRGEYHCLTRKFTNKEALALRRLWFSHTNSLNFILWGRE